jgi:3-deoxy-D-manno-octulosonic-acid transferase
MHIILRFCYILLSYLLTPLILLHLFYKGFGNRDYWKRNGERFGFYYGTVPSGAIWVHAVSVGEVQAAAALVNSLLEQYPQRPLVITTTTPTGADRVRALFGERVIHRYAPFDLAWPVKRFFIWCRPAIAIILETELWPNLYHECGRRKVPLVLASARVSPKSIGRYRMLVSLFKETLSHGIVIAAQTKADAERFLLLGANPQRTHVTGNIKFDFALPDGVAEQGAAFRAAYAANKPAWVAASTHASEEEIVLRAHRLVQEKIPDAVLILVPRHPERFAGVAALVERQGFRFVRRSTGNPGAADTEVVLGDTMGELMAFYAAADVAFVGGSLVKIGGHNLLEPAALRLPIITGPYTYNAADIAELFQDDGVAQVVNDAPELAAAVCELLFDPLERERLGNRAEALTEQSRGALARLLALLQPLLS